MWPTTMYALYSVTSKLLILPSFPSDNPYQQTFSQVLSIHLIAIIASLSPLNLEALIFQIPLAMKYQMYILAHSGLYFAYARIQLTIVE